MEYKLLLLDLDGTTVESNGEALPSMNVTQAVQAAQNHVSVAVATGRPYELAKPVIQHLGLLGPGIFNGGAEIIDMPTGKVISQELVSVNALRELVHLALPFGYNVYTDDSQYADPVTSAVKIDKVAAKLLIEAVAANEVTHILEQLDGVPGTSAHPTTSWEKGDVVDIHVTHEHATKRHGVEQLIAMLGLSKGQVIAIGDGYNDMPLLEAAGLKIAMGNAPSEVKQVADYVTTSLANDGVAHAIEKFVLQIPKQI